MNIQIGKWLPEEVQTKKISIISFNYLNIIGEFLGLLKFLAVLVRKILMCVLTVK